MPIFLSAWMINTLVKEYHVLNLRHLHAGSNTQQKLIIYMRNIVSQNTNILT
jgi:hypothetical protein